MTENHKKMLFYIEVIRRREHAFIQKINPNKEPVGTELMKLFLAEIGEPELFEPLLYGVAR
jgi:hypothetical protein